MIIVIKILDRDLAKDLENFLVLVNGDNYRDLANRYISCMFSDDFRKPKFIIAILDDKIVGAAAFSEELFTVNMWGISWVGVHPDYRNKGIGKLLIRECIDEIKKEAKSSVTCILAAYTDKIKFYEKLGFKTLSYDAEGAAIMTLPLTD